MAKVRKIDSKNIDDHLGESASFLEMGVKDAPVENVGWDVQQGEVHADPLIESGTGPKAIIRRFQFKLPPGNPIQITQGEMLEYHKKNTVIPLLWKDELELIMEPRIIAGKEGAFTIVAVCAPRNVMGVISTIHERPQLVQDIIKKNG